MDSDTKTKSAFDPVKDMLHHFDAARRSDDLIRQIAASDLILISAMTLGRLPKRQRRRWSGWVGDTHFWRGRRAILPNGIVVDVYGVLRGQAAVSWADPLWVGGVRRDVVPVDQLTVYKNPAARLMGMLKRGCREKSSPRKLATCRANGRCPVREGNRPRGRPTKQSVEAVGR